VNGGTPTDRELDGYRTGADRFIAELDEEYDLHYAGLKSEFELRPI
jgi:soluble cytochrome b562